MTRAALASPFALLALVSCAAPKGEYPSLAPRPIERSSETEPNRPVPVATPDASLDAAIVDAAARLKAADAEFTPAAERTRSLVSAAATAGVGSDAWLDAQTALAELDGYRAESTAAVSTLDELAIARASNAQPAYPALDSVHQQGEAQVAAESETIASFQAQLPAN